MEVTVTKMLLSFNVFNTVSHCMSLYLLSFGNAPSLCVMRHKKRSKARGGGDEVGKVSERDATQAINTPYSMV